MKDIQIYIYIVLIIIALLIIAYFALGVFFFNYSINPIFSKRKLFKGRPTKLASDNAIKWFAKVSKTEVYINSFDNIRLHAYKISALSNKYVIISHGYTNEGLDMLDYAKHYSELNYNVLLIDHRAHGKSDGKYSTMGMLESKDVLSWINYIIGEDKKSKIILHGISMGAYTIMLTTTKKDLPKNVLCAIEDCGFYSIYKQFYHQLKHEGHKPKIIISAANIFYIFILKVSVYKSNILNDLKKVKIPMLFIHGGKDKFVTREYLEEIYNSYGGKKEKLIIDNAKHMQSMKTDPCLYWNTVDKFIFEKVKDINS